MKKTIPFLFLFVSVTVGCVQQKNETHPSSEPAEQHSQEVAQPSVDASTHAESGVESVALHAPLLPTPSRSIALPDDANTKNFLVFGKGGAVYALNSDGIPIQEAVGTYLNNDESISTVNQTDSAFFGIGSTLIQGLNSDFGLTSNTYFNQSETATHLVKGKTDGSDSSWAVIRRKSTGDSITALSLPTPSIGKTHDANKKLVGIAWNSNQQKWAYLSEDKNIVLLTEGFTSTGSTYNQGSMTKPIGIVGVKNSKYWLFVDSHALHRIDEGGHTDTISLPSSIASSENFTVTTQDSEPEKILIGTDQGHVLSLDATEVGKSSPTATGTVITGLFAATSPIKFISNLLPNNEYIVINEEGSVRRIDGATMQPKGSELKDIVPASALNGAKLVGAGFVSGTKKYWFFSYDNGLVIRYKEDFTPLSNTLPPVLNGKDVVAVAPIPEKVFIGGEGKTSSDGAIQLIDANGRAVASPIELPGFGKVTAMAWSGSNLLVGSATGKVQLVKEDGKLSGSFKTPVSGKNDEITAIGWNGTDFMIGYKDGSAYLASSSGNIPSPKLVKVTGMDDLTGIASTPLSTTDNTETRWLIIGNAHSDGILGTALGKVVKNGTTLNPLKVKAYSSQNFTGKYTDVEANLIGYYISSSDGEIQWVQADGQTPSLAPMKLFHKQPVVRFSNAPGDKGVAISNNGLVHAFKGQKASKSIWVLNGMKDLTEIAYTLPPLVERGYCISSKCMKGSMQCLDGRCCEPCSSTCKSCDARLTGQEKYKCLPIKAGTPDSKCATTDPSSCGTTGTCDGKGYCTLHPATTVCAPSKCADGKFYATAECGTTGSCPAQTETSCNGFACDNTTGCKTTCSSNSDCESGYECQSGSCTKSTTSPGSNGSNGSNSNSNSSNGATAKKGGCSCSSTDNDVTPPLLLLAGIGLVAIRRRRKA